MRVWLLAYGVLYGVIELTGSALQTIGWPQLTALDVATALVDAFLIVSVALAVLLAAQLGARRWGGALLAPHPTGAFTNAVAEGSIGVRSWRPAPLALPAAAPSPPAMRSTYSVGAYGSGADRRARRLAPSFPEEPGHLL